MSCFFIMQTIVSIGCSYIYVFSPRRVLSKTIASLIKQFLAQLGIISSLHIHQSFLFLVFFFSKTMMKARDVHECMLSQIYYLCLMIVFQ